jgi:hypothetical protein
MKSALTRRRLAAAFLFITLFTCFTQAALAATRQVPLRTVRVRGPYRVNDSQNLYCDATYSIPECGRQIEMLRRALRPYPLALLANWKWVLVRADQWKPLAGSLHLDPDSPAVTLLDDDTILLEESLFVPRAERAAELMHSYSIALDELLDVAISHELGHAICHEQNEFRADHIGRDLRRQIAAGGPINVSCLRPVVPNHHEGR